MVKNLTVVIIAVGSLIAGAFISSPELRAYAANTVFSTDIVDGQVMTVDLANNAVTAAKVKDGEIKAPEIAANAVGASEIATDAVGAAELAGVTKLLFGQCKADSTEGTTVVTAGGDLDILCNISGVDADDSAIAIRNSGNGCFEVHEALRESNLVRLGLRNECSISATVGTGADFSIIVFDK